MDLANICLGIKIILGLLTIIGILLAGFWKWCPRIWILFQGKKTITLVNDDTGHVNFWHIGSQSGKPILQISCKFMGTNNTDHPVALARAIWRGGVTGSIEYAQVCQLIL